LKKDFPYRISKYKIIKIDVMNPKEPDKNAKAADITIKIFNTTFCFKFLVEK
jgi:hypothetical protein